MAESNLPGLPGVDEIWLSGKFCQIRPVFLRESIDPNSFEAVEEIQVVVRC